GQDTGQPEAFAAGAAHPGDPGPGLGAAAAVGRQGHVAGAGRNGHPRLPAGAVRHRAAAPRHSSSQASARARRRSAPGSVADVLFARLPGRPGLAHGRCDSQDPGAPASDAAPSARMDDGRPIGAVSAPGCARLLPPDGPRNGTGPGDGGRCDGFRAHVVAAGVAVRFAVAGRAGAGLMVQPRAHRCATQRDHAGAGKRAAPDRPAHLALLRNLRHAVGEHAAAGQLPGGPQAGARAPDLAHQHRPLPALGGERARLRLGRHDRNRGADRSGVRLAEQAGTLDLQPLAPAYVSSVDSGNLAGHLIVLANACEEWIAAPLAPRSRAGVADHLQLAREAMAGLPAASGEGGRQLGVILREIEAQTKRTEADRPLLAVLKRLADKAATAARQLLPMSEDGETPDLVYWIEAAGRAFAEHDRDRLQTADRP